MSSELQFHIYLNSCKHEQDWAGRDLHPQNQCITLWTTIIKWEEEAKGSAWIKWHKALIGFHKTTKSLWVLCLSYCVLVPVYLCWPSAYFLIWLISQNFTQVKFPFYLSPKSYQPFEAMSIWTFWGLAVDLCPMIPHVTSPDTYTSYLSLYFFKYAYSTFPTKIQGAKSCLQ